MVLFSVFFLASGLFISLLIFDKPITRLTRAKEEFKPSPEKSLLIGWPLTVKANGKALSSITVFVESGKGKPIAGKEVILTSDLGQVVNLQPITDKVGKAAFAVKSARPGIATINAFVKKETTGKLKLKKSLQIKFE